jgi:hypothetical protein
MGNKIGKPDKEVDIVLLQYCFKGRDQSAATRVLPCITPRTLLTLARVRAAHDPTNLAYYICGHGASLPARAAASGADRRRNNPNAGA